MYYKNIEIKSLGYHKDIEPKEYLTAALQIYNWIEAKKIQSQTGLYEINPEGPVDLTGGPVHGKYSLYSGSSGIGTLLLRLYEVTKEVHFLEEAKEIAKEAIEASLSGDYPDWNRIKSEVRDRLSGYFWKLMKRSPVILPIIMEI